MPTDSVEQLLMLIVDIGDLIGIQHCFMNACCLLHVMVDTTKLHYILSTEQLDMKASFEHNVLLLTETNMKELEVMNVLNDQIL